MNATSFYLSNDRAVRDQTLQRRVSSRTTNTPVKRGGSHPNVNELRAGQRRPSEQGPAILLHRSTEVCRKGQSLIIG